MGGPAGWPRRRRIIVFVYIVVLSFDFVVFL